MYINWEGFHDVEEFNTGPHSTGIKEYIIGLGELYITLSVSHSINIKECGDRH
jgi:hypothetical protein